ncbi:MAG: Lrp/AsnC family transcriptional regulator [Candidatus Bathyarchaeia archaeon]
MEGAFVLINTEIGKESEVLEKLNSIHGVIEAYNVYGVYDIIARLETESMDSIKEIVHNKIRELDRIKSTLTMVII